MSTLRTILLFTLFSVVLSHPLDTRSPDPPVPVIIGPPDSQIFPCTATFDVPPHSCTTSPLHAYSITETLYNEVNCAGCLAISLHMTSDYLCSAQTEAPLVTVDGTTTEWLTVCSPTPTLPDIHPRQDTPIARPSCPTTLMIPVESTGSTSTVFEEYITVTNGVPCGGCDLVTSTMVGGLGFVRPPAATVTAEIGTSTFYACDG